MAYMWNLKNTTNQWIQQQQKSKFTDIENKLMGETSKDAQVRGKGLRGTNYYV